MENERVGGERLRHVRHVVLDMDGTIYLGDRVFAATRPFLDLLARLGLGRSFITNNCSRSAEQYIEKLHRMGLDVKRDELFTSGHAMIEYLRSHHTDVHRLFVLGTPALCKEFSDAGFLIANGPPASIEPPDAVIVGFDTTLVYEQLCRAAYWIDCGKLYLATHPDRICPADGPIVLPDCGAICACLESATGRAPEEVVGKPSHLMIEGVLQRYDLQPYEVAVVGDRLYTDMEMARTAGAVAVLVLTGETNRDAAEAAEHRPDVIVEDLVQFGRALEDAKSPGE